MLTGILQDAVIMLLGAIMLSVATGTTINGWVIMYAISQLVYGVGVGGEQHIATDTKQ